MALPTVQHGEVPEEGLSLTCLVQPDELALTQQEGRFRYDLRVDLEIYPTEQGLSARGVLSGVALRECVRCLAEYEEPMQVTFAAEYRVKGQPKRGRGAADPADFEDTGEDVYPYDGERLEMAEMLREQVILSSPMQPLCRQDCLGLCPVCGQNRNQRLCSCSEPQDANPFAALRDFQARSSRKPAGPNGSTVKRSNSSRTE
jgi:uncharacterized protein